MHDITPAYNPWQQQQPQLQQQTSVKPVHHQQPTHLSYQQATPQPPLQQRTTRRQQQQQQLQQQQQQQQQHLLLVAGGNGSGPGHDFAHFSEDDGGDGDAEQPGATGGQYSDEGEEETSSHEGEPAPQVSMHVDWHMFGTAQMLDTTASLSMHGKLV